MKLIVAAALLSVAFSTQAADHGHWRGAFVCDDKEYSAAVAEAIVRGLDADATAEPFLKTGHCVMLPERMTFDKDEKLSVVQGPEGKLEVWRVHQDNHGPFFVIQRSAT